MFFDSNYLIWVMLPTLLLSGLAQMFVRSAYSKWSQQRNASGLTGAQVGERIIRNAGLTGVRLEITPGQLSDHYDPRTHVVRMSQDVAARPSVAAMAIVAHELGHAQQHAQKSGLIVARNFLLPAVQISPMVSYGMIFGGLLLNLTGLMWLGVVVFAVSVGFMLLTLPVEIDASMRGLRLLKETGLFQTSEDQGGARNVLTAAALTYVAAAVTSVLTLLYYISMVQRND
jgi:Zn-dependent membrane protease YugP